MKLYLSLVAVLGLAASPAGAAPTLSTIMVYSAAGTDILCNVVNPGKKTAQVVVRLRDLSGDILAESGAFTLDPGEGNGIGDGSNEDYFGWCEFEVVKGSRKRLRGSLSLRSGGPGNSPDVVVPAQ